MKKIFQLTLLTFLLTIIGCVQEKEILKPEPDLITKFYALLAESDYEVSISDNKVSVKVSSIKSVDQFIVDLSSLQLPPNQTNKLRYHLDKVITTENSREVCTDIAVDTIFFDDGEICMFIIDFCEGSSEMICG